MLKKFHKVVALVAIFSTLTSGCRSAQEYERLAKAGSTYVMAVDKLLEVEGNIRIDRTSEELLDLDRCNDLNPCNFVTRKTYSRLSGNDVDRLNLLEGIRKHNQLLSRYFFLLNQLASSKAPEQVQAAIDNIATNLAEVSNQIKPEVGNQKFAGRVTRLVVSGKIRGALRDELEDRKDTIQAELILQQQLLDLLANHLEENLKAIREYREERLVIKPLIDNQAITNANAWIATRRELLKMEATAKELRDASDAADEFRSVFEEFVSGKLTASRINTFLSDIKELVEVTEEFKKVIGEQT